MKTAIEDGVSEIDMVVNISDVKNGDYEKVEEEIKALREACGDKILKVIIETSLLTEEEIIKMTKICNDTYVNFIKTSTGFNGKTEVKDVKLINENKEEFLEIKASGGIDSEAKLVDMIEAGATRIGTSHATKIIEGGN